LGVVAEHFVDLVYSFLEETEGVFCLLTVSFWFVTAHQKQIEFLNNFLLNLTQLIVSNFFL
jgi:hypothetical protein